MLSGMVSAVACFVCCQIEQEQVQAQHTNQCRPLCKTPHMTPKVPRPCCADSPCAGKSGTALCPDGYNTIYYTVQLLQLQT